jgi:hypothetical protein
MTAADYQAEWKYRFEERVGILADGRTVTQREVQQAKIEADGVVERLRKLNVGWQVN